MTYVVIGAMRVEIESLCEALGAKNTDSFADFPIYFANVNNNKVYIIESGIGKVNSACATQVMIERYKPDYVINTGIAGGIDSTLVQGDVVISTFARYHDFNPIEILQTNRPGTYIFNAEQTLVQRAAQACEKNNIHYTLGAIASGDCFVADSAVVEYIRDDLKASCVEMEGASIAHVCVINKVAFVIIRAISDFADEDAENSYNSFEKTAAKNAADIVEYIIKG